MSEPFDIQWLDHDREPRHPPNPDYPDGIDLKVYRRPAEQEFETCTADLEYPAKRCGAWVVECRKCGSKAVCTTAGRPDDPRSIELFCRREQQEPAK